MAGKFGVARYHAKSDSGNGIQAGDLDSSFGIGGRVSIFSYVRRMELDSQGRLVLLTNGGVARLTAGGSADPSFNNGNAFYPGFYGEGMALEASDSIIVAGSRWNGTESDIKVARVTTGGQLDTTGFGVNDGDGTDGVASVDFGGRNDYGRFVALQQGKIVVAGQTEPLWDSLNQVYVDPSYDANDPNDVQSLTSDLTVLRLNADGTLDTSFGVGGPEGDGLTQDDLRVTGDAWDYTYSMAITSGNAILLGIYSNGYGWVRYSTTAFWTTRLPTIPLTPPVESTARWARFTP